MDFNFICVHFPCTDGAVSAWVYARYKESCISDIGEPVNEIYLRMQNGKNNLKTINLVNKKLLFIDYAPNDEEIALMDALNAEYMIIDHHITNAQRKFKCKTIFDSSKCGAMLAWEYFFGNVKPPKFLEIVQARDLWVKTVPEDEVNFISAGIHEMTYGFDIKDYIVFFNDFDYDKVRMIGEYNYKNRMRRVEIIAKGATKKMFKLTGTDLAVCIINCDNSLTSDLGNHILDNYRCDIVICWTYIYKDDPVLRTGEFWLSMRSKGDVDVSALCRTFGGGGHKNASGCTMPDISPLMDMML